MKNALINYIQNPIFDDIYTPYYAIANFVNYLDKNLVYWECCDNGSSMITKCLKDNGFKVVSTTFKELDFLKDDPSFHFDCIITNPPYSLKDEFLTRCYEYVAKGKKFALLLPLTSLEGIYRGKLFRDFGLQLLVYDKRINFLDQKKSNWFNTSWFCFGLLYRDLIFKEVYLYD